METTLEVAEWLNNSDGFGATDEEFAETMRCLDLLRQKKEPVINNAQVMKSMDTEAFCKWLKDCLDEIIFSEEIDESAWWKKEESKC